MNKDNNFQQWLLTELFPSHVVVFGSNQAQDFLRSEFGLDVSRLLRPFGTDRASKYLWAENNNLTSNDNDIDIKWRERVCLEYYRYWPYSKNIMMNKPPDSDHIWFSNNTHFSVKINAMNKMIKADNINIRFISLCNTKKDVREMYEDLTVRAVESCRQFSRSFSMSEIVSKIISGTGRKYIESLAKEILKKEDSSLVNNVPFIGISGLPIWLERWFQVFYSELNFATHETISQPIGGMIFVLINEESLDKTCETILDGLRTGISFTNIDGNSNYYHNQGYFRSHYLQETYLNDFPLVFILISDSSLEDNCNLDVQSIISKLKQLFPENEFYLWNIKGISKCSCSESIFEEQKVDKPVSIGSYAHPYLDTTDYYMNVNRFLTHSDMELLRSIIFSCVTKNFVLWIQNTMNRLYNTVNQSRKGIKSHLRMFWRRPKPEVNTSMNSDSFLSTLGMTNAISNLDDKSQLFESNIPLFTSYKDTSAKKQLRSPIIYSASTIEGQTRILADLCFLIGDFSSATQYYKQILSDYKLDKSYMCMGSTYEILAVCQVATGMDLEAVSNLLLNACNSYQRSSDYYSYSLYMRSIIFLVISLFNSPDLYSVDSEFSISDLSGSFRVKYSTIYDSIIDKVKSVIIDMQNLDMNSKYFSWILPNDKGNYSTEYNSTSRNEQIVRSTNISKQSILNFAIMNDLFTRLLALLPNDAHPSGSISRRNLYCHKWYYHSILAAQAFQYIGFKAISLQSFLNVLLQEDTIKWPDIDTYLRFHSANLCHKLSFFSESVLLFISLIYEIILRCIYKLDIKNELDALEINNEKSIADDTRLSKSLGDNILLRNSTFLGKDDKEDFIHFNKLQLLLFKGFVESFTDYLNNLKKENEDDKTTQHSFQLRLPLPILLPVGTSLILESDHIQTKAVNLLNEDLLAGNNLSSNNCICSHSRLTKLLGQNLSCSSCDSINGKDQYCISADVTIPKGHNSFCKFHTQDKSFVKDDHFVYIKNTIDRLLDMENKLENLEVLELQYQYFLQNRQNLIEQIQINDSTSLNHLLMNSCTTRYTFVGNKCIVEFYLYNPLSFSINCESLHLWGHLRMSDGTTLIYPIIVDESNLFDEEFVDAKNINIETNLVFFSKSISLKPNESRLFRLIAVPFTCGDLFLVGISFLLDGKVPIRQSFNSPILSKESIGNYRLLVPNIIFNSNLKDTNFSGIVKISILSDLSKLSMLIDIFSFKNTPSSETSSEGYKMNNYNSLAGIPYNFSVQLKNSSSYLVNGTKLFIIPLFSRRFNISVWLETNPNELKTSSNEPLLYHIPSIGAGQIKNISFSIWVNSECLGSIYIILVTSGKNQSDQCSGLMQNKLRSHRLIVMAKKNVKINKSISMYASVFSNGLGMRKSIFIRCINNSIYPLNMHKLSIFPSKWIENTEIEDKQDKKYIPSVIIIKDFDNKEISRSQNCLKNMDSNTSKIRNENSDKIIFPGRSFQMFVQIDENYPEFLLTNISSVLNVDLILEWSLYPLNSEKLSNLQCFGQCGIFDLKLWTSPNLLTSNIKDKKSSLIFRLDIIKDKCRNFSNGHLKIVNVIASITNTSEKCTTLCSLICTTPKLSNDQKHEDLLVPQSDIDPFSTELSSSSMSLEHDKLEKSDQSTCTILSSGELIWIGPTTKYLTLLPNSSVNVYLKAITPINGLFNTNSIQLIIMKEIPIPNILKQSHYINTPIEKYIQNTSVVYQQWHPCDVSKIIEPITFRLALRQWMEINDEKSLNKRHHQLKSGKESTFIQNPNLTLLPVYRVNKIKSKSSRKKSSNKSHVLTSSHEILVKDNEFSIKYNSAINQLVRWALAPSTPKIKHIDIKPFITSSTNSKLYSHSYKGIVQPRSWEVGCILQI
ncbi:uncharacterized protein CMU_020450 [Cryptosporidium muris RN66]|uniref:Uncharacterized protein n=1 Tax=Cryptosporidium muris (strain RN66) TaxID=441375 RepID=B6AJ64_CRYMR|nr:uncharacterized protein CMU_020450 [Cryptosporidium muris RN66]EEA08301.1 hypothetical protein, conserved [Cryptosporidium muris RN66]|eukprot:XP_002142650.1 hypothetical protein [Cryptosporidium muris RN66]